MQCSEKLAGYFHYTVGIKFQVIPRRRISNHIPTQRVRTILFDGTKRINSITQALGHFISILVKHQSVRDNIFIGYTIEYHSCDSMQCKEPATSLVYPFSNEVSRIIRTIIYNIFILKRIMQLCVWHGA